MTISLPENLSELATVPQDTVLAADRMVSREHRPQWITLPDDDLILGADLAVEWKCTRRTLLRYESEGLPFAMVGGRKYRPLRASREWLAGRVRHPNPRRVARRTISKGFSQT
jgi:hypothetical protein